MVLGVSAPVIGGGAGVGRYLWLKHTAKMREAAAALHAIEAGKLARILDYKIANSIYAKPGIIHKAIGIDVEQLGELSIQGEGQLKNFKFNPFYYKEKNRILYQISRS